MAKKDYSIKGTAKVNRLKEIEDYKNNLGDGLVGISEIQKHNRIEKYLGEQANKIKGFGKDKNKGVELFTKAKEVSMVLFENEGPVDRLPKEIMDSVEDYPVDPTEVVPAGSKNKCKVLNLKVYDSGSMDVEGIIIDGKENDIKERSTFGITYATDKEMLRSTKRWKESGELREVSDRVLSLLEETDLKEILESSEVDTDIDKKHQY